MTKAYGYPHVQGYDGVYHYGRTGKYILTRSILNILNEAKVVPNQPNPVLSPPAQQPTYEPMRMLRERIKSTRSAPRSVSPSSSPPHSSSSSSCLPPQASAHPARISVIKPVIQDMYSVPVFNPFDVLGN